MNKRNMNNYVGPAVYFTALCLLRASRSLRIAGMFSFAQPIRELTCGSKERVRSVIPYSTLGGTSA